MILEVLGWGVCLAGLAHHLWRAQRPLRVVTRETNVALSVIVDVHAGGTTADGVLVRGSYRLDDARDLQDPGVHATIADFALKLAQSEMVRATEAEALRSGEPR